MFKTYCRTLLLILLFSIVGTEIFAETVDNNVAHVPVDVSYLIVDMKYHNERGVQICEIQHGVASTFKGEKFSNNGTSFIAQNLVHELDKFYEKSWVEIKAVADVSAKDLLSQDNQWIKVNNLKDLEKDNQFLLRASLPVYDPEDLFSYHGFVLMNTRQIAEREILKAKYPGVLFIDNGSYIYRRDKYKMSQLLRGHPVTEKHKPKWGSYKTKYNKNLAKKINKEIRSDLLVIKPLDEFKGKGVIILKKEDLDKVLKGILTKDITKLDNKDPAYQYWMTHELDQFVVEEFIHTDPVAVPHLNGNLYSPTLRLVFLLFYNKRNIEIVCLGGYYSLPQKALSEEGSLNEKYKSYCVLPYYCKADPEIMKKAEAQLREVLTIVYRKMLGLE